MKECKSDCRLALIFLLHFIGLFLESRAFDTYGVVKAGTSLTNYLNRIYGK